MKIDRGLDCVDQGGCQRRGGGECLCEQVGVEQQVRDLGQGTSWQWWVEDRSYGLIAKKSDGEAGLGKSLAFKKTLVSCDGHRQLWHLFWEQKHQEEHVVKAWSSKKTMGSLKSMQREINLNCFLLIRNQAYMILVSKMYFIWGEGYSRILGTPLLLKHRDEFWKWQNEIHFDSSS